MKFLGGYPFGRCSKGLASGVINNSQYVFVSSGSSIMILNTDDPSHPVKVGQIITPIKELFPFLVDTLLDIDENEQKLEKRIKDELQRKEDEMRKIACRIIILCLRKFRDFGSSTSDELGELVI